MAGPNMRWGVWFGVLILAGVSASAQTTVLHHHAPDSETKLRELPPPPLMTGIGDASLKISTNSEQAQAYFNQGLKLLHCFWDFEAYRAFKEAARLDPGTAMAYWGEYQALKMMGHHGSIQEAKDAALAKAQSLADHVSDHEQLYIRAAQHQAKADDSKESAAYRQVMETLIDRYPDDLDAQALLALEEMSGYKTDGQPRDGELYSQAILRNLLAAHPDNAAANHYWIHAMEDSSRPEEALRSADALGRRRAGASQVYEDFPHLAHRANDLPGRFPAGNHSPLPSSGHDNLALECDLPEFRQLRPGGVPLPRDDRLFALDPHQPDVLEHAGAGLRHRP